MISDELLTELNKQVKFEYESAHYYLAIANYFRAEDLEGFAHFFEVQAEEERFHAEKFTHFIDELGAVVKLKGLGDPKNDFDSPQAAFEYALEHEKFITKRINQLMDIAHSDKNYAAVNFLNWFIEEQVEEEASMDELINKLERISDDGAAIYMLNEELAQRTFDPQAEE